MHPFNKYFDKVIVLALREDEQRLEQIYEQLNGIEFEFIWGPNIRSLFPNAKLISDIPESFFCDFDVDKNAVLHWSLGGLGCGLGHRMMIKSIIDSNLSKVLLLEDDIILVDNAIDYFNESVKFIPPNWDLLYLGYDYPSRLMKSKLPFFLKKIVSYIKKLDIIGLNASVQGKNYFPQKINKYIHKSGVCIGGHAYALTSISAKNLYDQNMPLKIYSDQLLMQNVYHGNLIAYNLNKSIINQNKNLNSYTE